ncbi:MAG: hypothetical protein LUD22_00745 [Coprobacillus sp.]|nr:hypothetical protein [Coprobacillus sp.]
MKREKLVVLLSCFILTLSGCNETFDPFDFNNLDIISSEVASFISNEATNNLSNVNNLRKSISSVSDYREAYLGSASSLARYSDTESESEISIYELGYINETRTVETDGDGFGNTLYFESYNRDSSFLEETYLEEEDNQETYYTLYQVNEYENPNYSENVITSLRSSLFGNSNDVYFKWDKLIRDLVGDSYVYSDFSYGSSDGKIYAFIQEVNQGNVVNPLHNDEIIITYTERMVVRYFRYDDTYGWVIDYFAEKENLYYVTSLEGGMYESPLLVESSESYYKYQYGKQDSYSFEIPSGSSSLDAYPVISTYELEEGNPTLVSTNELSDCYLITSYKDDDRTYLSSLIDFYPEELYLFSSSNLAYSDQFLGYDIINYDQLSIFNYIELDTYKYIEVSSSVRVYLIFGFTREGELVSVDSFYWSNL